MNLTPQQMRMLEDRGWTWLKTPRMTAARYLELYPPGKLDDEDIEWARRELTKITLGHNKQVPSKRKAGRVRAAMPGASMTLRHK